MDKKKIITYALSFALAVSIGISSLAGGLNLGFFFEGSVQTAFTEVDGVDGVREKLLDQINYGEAPYGMDRLVFEKIITHDLVHEDAKTYIISQFTKEEFVPDYKALEDNYYFSTGQMLSEKNITITSQGDTAIKDYFETFKPQYQKAMMFEGVKIFADLSSTYSTGLQIVCAIFGGIALMLIAALWLLGGDRRRKIIFGFFGAGLMTLVFPVYMLIDKPYLRVIANSQLIYDFYVRMFRNGFANMAAFGLAFLVLGLGIGIYGYLSSDETSAPK